MLVHILVYTLWQCWENTHTSQNNVVRMHWNIIFYWRLPRATFEIYYNRKGWNFKFSGCNQERKIDRQFDRIAVCMIMEKDIPRMYSFCVHNRNNTSFRYLNELFYSHECLWIKLDISWYIQARRFLYMIKIYEIYTCLCNNYYVGPPSMRKKNVLKFHAAFIKWPVQSCTVNRYFWSQCSLVFLTVVVLEGKLMRFQINQSSCKVTQNASFITYYYEKHYSAYIGTLQNAFHIS